MSDEEKKENSIIPHGGESEAKKAAVSMLSSATRFAGSAADIVGAVHGRYIAARDNEVRARTDIEDGEKSRIVVRTVQQQRNIDAVAEEIPKHMEGDDDAAKAEKLRNMNPDVAARSADECKHVSDKYMRTLWAKALAGEADNPGSFSIRTAVKLKEMDKKDAELFRAFCQFVWIERSDINAPVPLIYSESEKIYNNAGINYSALDNLEEMGLISRKPEQFGRWYNYPDRSVWSVWCYHGKFYRVSTKLDAMSRHFISCGIALLTRVGKQIYSVCEDNVEYNPMFHSYVIQKWTQEGMQPEQIR